MSLAVVVGVVVVVPAITLGYIWLADRITDRLGRYLSRRLRPWVWLFPALAAISVFLVVPAVLTAWSSLRHQDGSGVGLDNYQAVLGREDVQVALRNNATWVVVVVGLVLLLSIAAALLVETVRYERAVTMILFLPMAVSATASAVLWQLMYAFSPANQPQTGTVNAALVNLPGQPEPVAWLLERSTNNWALMAVAIWTWTGLGLVVILAGLKNLPDDVVEAARIDGAGRWQVARYITLPLLLPTISVVATTLIVFVLKVFDFVQVLTRGERGTEVLANAMYTEFFINRRENTASAIAMILMILVLPMIVISVRRSTREV